MDAFFARSLQQLLDRTGGPMHLRFILQPITAALIAIRAGIRDSKSKSPPYLWSLVFHPAMRSHLLREGRRDILKVFTFAFLLDVIYQCIELSWIYPLQAVIIALLLAVIPYVVLRGPVARIARWWKFSADPRP
jgi:apolipoprotein N-acyltransferase